MCRIGTYDMTFVSWYHATVGTRSEEEHLFVRFRYIGARSSERTIGILNVTCSDVSSDFTLHDQSVKPEQWRGNRMDNGMNIEMNLEMTFLI